ncbi:hypothetical protein FD754_025429, partial [Muntiacus muntjak]
DLVVHIHIFLFRERILNDSLSKKPSLSAQGGPVVRPGENVTLLCSSEHPFDQFHLLREGENVGRLLAGGLDTRGALQAEFPLGPGTPAHSGVYRCYGSFKHSPYEWSDPSDPLLLSVTEPTTSTCPSTTNPHTTEEPEGGSPIMHKHHALMRGTREKLHQCPRDLGSDLCWSCTASLLYPY